MPESATICSRRGTVAANARRDRAEDECRNESPIVERMAVAGHRGGQLGSTAALRAPWQPGETAHRRRHRLARPYRRDSGHDGTGALDPRFHPRLRRHPALRQLFPNRSPERSAASGDVSPPAREVNQRSPTRRGGGDQAGRATRGPDAGVENGQVEASTFPFDRATDQSGQSEALAPSESGQRHRSFDSQAIALQPSGQHIPQPLKSRVVERRHGPGPLTSRSGGAGGRPTGNARVPHPAPRVRAGLRRSRGSAPRGSTPTCARWSSRSQGRVRSAA